MATPLRASIHLAREGDGCDDKSYEFPLADVKELEERIAVILKTSSNSEGYSGGTNFEIIFWKNDTLLSEPPSLTFYQYGPMVGASGMDRYSDSNGTFLWVMTKLQPQGGKEGMSHWTG